MAITHYSQRHTYNSKHWLHYQDFCITDDSTGNDYIQLQQTIRETCRAVQEELQPHGIMITDIRVEEGYDHLTFERLHRLAIGFGNKEDLAMAKILIKCHV